MTIRYTVLWLFSLFGLLCNAQTMVYGIVTDSIDSQELFNCSVLVKQIDGKIINYTFTDTAGAFSLNIKNISGLKLEVANVGYKKKIIDLSTAVFPLSISLATENFVLKEVAVRASPIKEQGDTITYYVSSFANSSDRTIGDVLKRMPGITVARDGRITYQGNEISNFYIENGNLLGGKYGVAANGISQEDVGAVEVLQNHQPLKVLQGVSFSEQAAINLKLKSGAKATWILYGSIGGGYSNNPKGGLWQGDFFAMSVMPKFQSLITIKSDNTGREIGMDLIDFTSSVRHTDVANYFDLSAEGSGSLDFKRKNFNRSLMTSVNNLWKLSHGYTLKAQIDYNFNRVQSTSLSNTIYFLEDGNKMIKEINRGIDREHAVTAKFDLESNQRNYYLSNTLKTEIEWDKVKLYTEGTFNNFQTADLPDFYISNELKLYKKFSGKHFVTINSINEWESRYNSLYISENDLGYGQKIKNGAFYTNENVSYRFTVKGLSISLKGGIEVYVKRLLGVSSERNLSQLYGDMSYFRTNLTPSLEYFINRFDISLDCPLSYNYYNFKGHIPDRNIPLYSPSLKVHFKPIRGVSLSISGGYGNSTLPLSKVYSGLLMTDYRSYQYGYPEYPTAKRYSIMGHVSYQHVKKGLFSNLMFMHTWNELPYTNMRNFDGDYIFNSYEKAFTQSRMLMVICSVNKAIDLIGGGAGFSCSYNKYDRSLISQGSNVRYYSRSLNAEMGLNGKFAQWLFGTLKFKYNYSSLDMRALLSKRGLNSFVHSFVFNVYPISKWSIEVSGDLYCNEVSHNSYTSIFLLDSKLRYKSSKRFEIVASLTNIMNKKEYSYTNYGAVAATKYSTSLRGREFLITFLLKK